MRVETAYRLKLYPGRQRTIHLFRCAGAARWLWNRLLDLEQKRYEDSGEFIFRFDMQAMLPGLKREFPWLTEVPASTLQRVCRNLDLALRGSFKARGKDRTGFPRFKAKYGSKTSFYVSNDTLRVEGNKIVLPKIGAVRFRGGRLPDGKMMSATVAFDGRSWWCTVQCQLERLVEPVEPVAETVVAVDAGVRELLVASDGERVIAPRPLRKALKRLARAQRILARRNKGSERRKRAAARVRHLHVVVGNCRRDTLHKATRALVDRASAVVVEDLNVKGMARSAHLGLSIADAALGEMRRQITYKLKWEGKTLILADRFFPSTQACSACGNVLSGDSRLTLAHRTYRCDCCGHVMDRDLNAALNLRRYGLHSLGLLSPDTITVGQAMPEPAEIHTVPPPYARRESDAGPGAPAPGRHGSPKREPQTRKAPTSASTSNAG